MTGGAWPLVRAIDNGWLLAAARVDAADLVPLPMKYYRGEVPA